MEHGCFIAIFSFEGDNHRDTERRRAAQRSRSVRHSGIAYSTLIEFSLCTSVLSVSL